MRTSATADVGVRDAHIGNSRCAVGQRQGGREGRPLQGAQGVRLMRIVVAAGGRLKEGPERGLAGRYRGRAVKAGGALGRHGPDVIEVKESRAREAERRVTEEAIALSGAMPDKAIKIVLDSRGQNASSDALAGLIRTWRDGG